MKMIFHLWFLSILAFLVADVKTGISHNKGIFRCYTCNASNTIDCNSFENQSQVDCPLDLPYCGTIAKTPDFTSSLTCTAGSLTPCTLILTAMDTYEMTCTCDGHLCNKPFIPEFRNELLNFSSIYPPANATRGLLEMFMNSSVFVNVTSVNLYEAVTQSTLQPTNQESVPETLTFSSTVSSNAFNDVNIPRAEALKHEATVPSDDDEDESEGSGAFEEAKPQAPAAPAAPSSFLPADENTASLVHISLLATIPFISLYTVA